MEISPLSLISVVMCATAWQRKSCKAFFIIQREKFASNRLYNLVLGGFNKINNIQIIINITRLLNGFLSTHTILHSLPSPPPPTIIHTLFTYSSHISFSSLHNQNQISNMFPTQLDQYLCITSHSGILCYVVPI